jgi:hypothetical protein
MSDDRDVFQEMSSESWGSRLKDSCCGICIGMLLFFGAFPLLFWNEGRAVERYDTLNEGRSSTTSIGVNSIDSANDGNLVHFTAEISSNGANLTDPIFGTTTDDLKFRRSVEMYQWTEQKSTTTKTKTGGKKETITKYSYSKNWESGLSDSSSFNNPSGHENPSAIPYDDLQLQQDIIYAGEFQLPPVIVSKISWYTPLKGLDVSEIYDATLRNNSQILTSEDGFFIGNSLYELVVGDTRATFESVQPGVISVIAQQEGNSLGTYQAEAGGTILLFQRGNLTVDEMYVEAEAANATTTWILRLVGYLVMGFGIYLVFRPIEVFADVIPILGDIVRCGLIFMALFIAGLLSGITISIAWLIHHPMIGGIVLVSIVAFTCGVAWLFKHFQKKNEPAKPVKPAGKPNPDEEDPEQLEMEEPPTGDFGDALDDNKYAEAEISIDPEK